MDARIKELWVEDLRNNTDKQGKLVLRTSGDRFCCLGRLCELYRIETGNGEWEQTDVGYDFVINGTKENVSLPDPVAVWAEVDAYEDMEGGKNLPQLNDDTELGFVGIASIIERKL